MKQILTVKRLIHCSALVWALRALINHVFRVIPWVRTEQNDAASLQLHSTQYFVNYNCHSKSVSRFHFSASCWLLTDIVLFLLLVSTHIKDTMKRPRSSSVSFVSNVVTPIKDSIDGATMQAQETWDEWLEDEKFFFPARYLFHTFCLSLLTEVLP